MFDLKVLITGSKGQLGYELQRSRPDHVSIIATDVDTLDICQPESIKAAFKTHQPDIVINAAAYTAVDKAESEPELVASINTEGARNLAETCAENAIRMVQVSTDFVFDGQSGVLYQPDSTINPQSVYAATKAKGDAAMLDVLGEHGLVMRTSWLYSAHGHNFVKTMLALMNERDELGIVSDQIGTPTWAKPLAEAIWIAIEKQLYGIQHWSDAGVASWYDFAQAIYEEGLALNLVHNNVQIKPILTVDYPTPAKRPAFSVMDKTQTWQALAYPAKHWRESLRQMMAELANA